jgi:hypothetical protein
LRGSRFTGTLERWNAGTVNYYCSIAKLAQFLGTSQADVLVFFKGTSAGYFSRNFFVRGKFDSTVVDFTIWSYLLNAARSMRCAACLKAEAVGCCLKHCVCPTSETSLLGRSPSQMVFQGKWSWAYL